MPLTTERIEKLSYRARVLQAALEKEYKKNMAAKARASKNKGMESTDPNVVLANMNIIMLRVFEQTRPKMFNILLKELRAAIRDTKEFNIATLKTNIEHAFSDENMITLDVINGFIDIHPELAGTWSDYIEGVAMARTLLGVSGKGELVTRAFLWKNLIYSPAREGVSSIGRSREGGESADDYAKRSYLATIRARVSSWLSLGVYAPYWYALEYGNPPPAAGEGSEHAYPQYPGAHFVYKARQRCQDLFDVKFQAAIDIMLKSSGRTAVAPEYRNVFSKKAVRAKEVLHVINTFILRYMRGDLGQANPSTILAELMVPLNEEIDQKMYLYVTPGRKIGVGKRRPP